ncbi:MAG: DUF167 domain-containing protein [Caulobacteraceae bacterium]|nr:DUF167 domain-containing protein [Caulobacteraceae bacterium]
MPACRLAVRLTPRGGRDAIEGWALDGAGRPFLKARVAAAPTDGEANAALRRLVARAVGRPASAVRIVAGETARLKQVEIEGLDQAALDAAFPRP